MPQISEVEDLVLQHIQHMIEEGLVDFKSLQCPRCGRIGGLEALTGSTAVVTFTGCRHQLYGDLAEAYLAKAFPGSDARRVIATEINLSHLTGSVPISTFEGDRNGRPDR